VCRLLVQVHLPSSQNRRQRNQVAEGRDLAFEIKAAKDLKAIKQLAAIKDGELTVQRDGRGRFWALFSASARI